LVFLGDISLGFQPDVSVRGGIEEGGREFLTLGLEDWGFIADGRVKRVSQS
jgi:hypothetical protein